MTWVTVIPGACLALGCQVLEHSQISTALCTHDLCVRWSCRDSHGHAVFSHWAAEDIEASGGEDNVSRTLKWTVGSRESAKTQTLTQDARSRA